MAMRARRYIGFTVAALGGLAAGCCSAPQNFMIGTGGVGARAIAWLGWEAIIAFCAATLVTWAFLLWFALRRRGTLAEHEPVDINQGPAWILMGRPITIQVQSADVMHSFWVPKLQGKIDLIPGRKNFVQFKALAPGTYLGQCASYCGEQHAHMKLRVIALTPKDYGLWLAHQRAPAAAPHSLEAIHGEQVFLGAACSLCHTIRGTPAGGAIGPDLTHLASRQTIAGGMLPSDTADLEAWVTHAQSLKPGTPMPNLPEFRGADLRALVTYLQSLK